MVLASSKTQPPSTKVTPLTKIQFVKCDCYRFIEEYTLAYIPPSGNAIKAVRFATSVFSTEEALDQHISFYVEFR
ncbi:hypothetical protein SLA2020_300690 [Shorea laevis]